MSDGYKVVPVEGECTEPEYGSRQYGWMVIDPSGIEVLHCVEGGTGECWNIGDPQHPEDSLLHVCELDDLIAALQALKGSEAHRLHVEYWS